MANPTGYLGAVASADFVTNERPENWRQGLFLYQPQGRAPLFAMTSNQKVEAVDDPKFHWWEKQMAAQAGDVTNMYQDVALANAITAGNTAAGTTIFAKVPVVTANEIRAGHVVSLRLSTNMLGALAGKVTAVDKNGADSIITIKTLEVDRAVTNADLSDCDRIAVVGDLNAENAEMPSALSYEPTEFHNLTEIFRGPLEISGTALETRLRTGNKYKELKREALELHSAGIEYSAFFGVRNDGTGADGKPERTTEGIIPRVRRLESANEVNYVTSTDSSANGKSWEAGGQDWLNEQLERLTRFSSGNATVFCGSGALQGLEKLALVYGNFQLKAGSTSFGMNFRTWVNSFGSFTILTHPLFTFNSDTRNMMVLFDPKNMIWRPLKNRDTHFRNDDRKMQSKKGAGRDGIKEEWLTEGGWQMNQMNTFMVLYGVGLDNAN